MRADRDRPTIVVDFHGVICHHPEGERGITLLDWPPVLGAIPWLRAISSRYHVVLTSARFARAGIESPDMCRAARQWLVHYGIPIEWVTTLDDIPRIEVTAHRPPAVLTLDDRAMCFRGEFPTIDQVERFRPWNRAPVEEMH